MESFSSFANGLSSKGEDYLRGQSSVELAVNVLSNSANTSLSVPSLKASLID